MPALIRTALFPVAGRGTRFLPATKAIPKEMLPVVDVPLIQYAVTEALDAGVSRLVFITGPSKRAIEEHFDPDPALEARLEADAKHDLVRALRGILPSYASCIYVRQPAPLGSGHAILQARSVAGNEPFFVHLADDLIDADVPVLDQLRRVQARTGGSLIGVEAIDPAQTHRYGVVDPAGPVDPVARLRAIVEKPAADVAPSNLAVVGRYLFTPRLFEHLVDLPPAANGEIQLTDAIATLMQEEAVHAVRFDGRRYDCGHKLGYLQATVDYALKDPDLGSDFAAWLASRVPHRSR